MATSQLPSFFGELPYEDCGDGVVKIQVDDPEKIARKLLISFTERAFRRPLRSTAEIEPFLEIYHRATRARLRFHGRHGIGLRIRPLLD